jgi:hypothetical protein
MDSDRMSGLVAMRIIVALLAAASLAFKLSPAQAQVAPGIVVTSPHVWQPGGSAPPYGMRLLPGTSGVVELSFTNTTAADAPRHRPRLFLRESLLDYRTRYEILPSSDPRCGAWEPAPPETPPGSSLAYTLDVGPLPAGATLVCRWDVRRSVPGGDDLVLSVPGLVGGFVHIGNIPDIEVSMTQLTPMLAGVSRAAQFRLTVSNPGPVDLLALPMFGLCQFPAWTGPAYRPDGPDPCQRAALFCFPDTSLVAITIGTVPAGQTRSCTFAVQYDEPLRQVGQLVVPTFPARSIFLSTTGYTFDPNPANNQLAPLLTVSPAEIGLFGDREQRFALVLVLMLGMLLAVGAWFRLRLLG